MLIKFLPSFTEITIDDIRLRVVVEVETNSRLGKILTIDVQEKVKY